MSTRKRGDESTEESWTYENGKLPAMQVSVREYIERVLNERDRYYEQRFKAAEIAVTAALSAQEKQTTISFASSEKAITKAEDAQRDYNVRSNEFRGQLDDQAKTLMPRTESLSLHKATDDKLNVSRNELITRMETIRAAAEKNFDVLKSEIAGLRESREHSAGKSHGSAAVMAYIVAAVSVVGALLTAGITLFKNG